MVKLKKIGGLSASRSHFGGDSPTMPDKRLDQAQPALAELQPRSLLSWPRRARWGRNVCHATAVCVLLVSSTTASPSVDIASSRWRGRVRLAVRAAPGRPPRTLHFPSSSSLSQSYHGGEWSCGKDLFELLHGHAGKPCSSSKLTQC